MDAVLHRVSSPTFVGRADELASLESALDRAAAGVPAFTFVAGESGIGKSRLLAEFEARSESAGARVLVGHCLELGGTSIPYAPLIDALRPIARELGEQRSQLPAGTRTALTALMPELGGAEADDGGGHQARIFEALLALLERMGREQPVVLLIEDLHWADPSTRDFLTFLVRNARTERVSLVVTYRSDELHRRHPLRPLLAELERTPGVERIGLDRFSRDEVVAQISGILDEPASDELADQVFERSEGNALYTEELLAASSEGCLELPDSLRDLLLHRVERLPAGALEAVRVISVEHPMRHALLAALCELGPAELTQGLRDAVAHQVLVAGPGETYAFRHALVGEAVYGDLLPGERSELHARLADTLEAAPELMGDVPAATVSATLACHWAAAHDMPRALGASVRAGLASKRVYAYSESARHFERALELWDRVPDAAERAGCDKADVLRYAAGASSNAGALSRAVALMRKSIEQVDAEADPGRVAFLLERLGQYLRLAGETEESLVVYERALEVVPAGDSDERARVTEQHARAHMLRGHFDQASAGAEQALEMAERVGAEAIAIRALNTLGVTRTALSWSSVEDGVALLRRSRDLAAAGGYTTEYVVAVTNLSDVLDVSGRTEEALEEIQAAMTIVRENPERTVYDTFMEAQGANLMLRLGQVSEVEDELPTAKFGDDIGSTMRLVCQLRGRLAVITGDVRTARRELDEQRRVCKGTVDPQWMEPLFGDLAELALLEDRIEDARQAIRDGVAILEGSQDGLRLSRLLWIGTMVEATAIERERALGEAGRGDRIEELLAALSAAEALPGQWAEGPLYAALAHAEVSRARVALGEGEPDPGAWEAVAARFAELSYPRPAGYAGFRAAEAYVQAGDRTAAVAPLTAARAAADGTRALPLLEEIDALARRARLSMRAAAPAAPEPPEADDPAARLGLTPREHEVLLLVAAGRTNREIGAELYMSEKTASVHVSRILAKLGVSGRVEAAAVAHRLGLVAA